MAQGPNYNVILPFSTTNTVVPSTIVVGGLTVNGTISAQKFVALSTGTSTNPAFTFTGVGTNAGMFLDTVTPALNFAYLGSTVGGFELRSFQGGPTLPAFRLGSNGGTLGAFITFDPTSTARMAFFAANATTPADLFSSIFRILPASSNNGMISSDGVTGFVFDNSGNPAIMNNNIAAGYAAVWDVAGGGQYYSMRGFYQVATTTAVPSIVRSDSHVTNLVAGITTVFVQLPTSVPGLQYTVSNARAVANTVVISPVGTADVLNVFGLTKAAGASVAASAAFASITFHCITSTQWLATDIMGTWV